MRVKWLWTAVFVAGMGSALGANAQTAARPAARPTPAPRARTAPLSKQDAKAYRAAMMPHMNEIHACYDQRINQGVKEKGRVLVAWFVDERGQASHVQVLPAESTIRDATLNNCITGKIKSWKWPPAKKGKLNLERFPFFFDYKGGPVKKTAPIIHK